MEKREILRYYTGNSRCLVVKNARHACQDTHTYVYSVFQQQRLVAGGQGYPTYELQRNNLRPYLQRTPLNLQSRPRKHGSLSSTPTVFAIHLRLLFIPLRHRYLILKPSMNHTGIEPVTSSANRRPSTNFRPAPPVIQQRLVARKQIAVFGNIPVGHCDMDQLNFKILCTCRNELGMHDLLRD